MSSWLSGLTGSALHYVDNLSGGMIYPPHREGDCGEYSDASDTHTFTVRGKTYLFDNRKVSSPGSMSKLLGVHIFDATDSRIDHIVNQGRMKVIMDELLRCLYM